MLADLGLSRLGSPSRFSLPIDVASPVPATSPHVRWRGDVNVYVHLEVPYPVQDPFFSWIFKLMATYGILQGCLLLVILVNVLTMV